MWKGERGLNSVDKDFRRDDLHARLLVIGPQRVYGGLIEYANAKGWKSGWAAHAFKEIFGDWPRPQDRGEPVILGDFIIESWVMHRKKRPRRRIEKQAPAPLLDRVGKPVASAEKQQGLDEHGFVPGTLMKPEDYEVKW